MKSARIPDLIRLYDSTAWYWDSPFHRALYQRSYFRLFETLEAHGWLRQQNRPFCVIDCGTGTGLLMTALGAAVDRSLDIYAVDISSKMLEFGCARLLGYGFRAKPVIASAGSLPFRDREMDLAMAALVLEHIPKPYDAVPEMARVTSHQGTVLFVTTRPHAPDLLFRLKFGYRPLRHEELLQWMTNAGIRNIWSVPLPGLAWPLARMYVGTRLE